MARQSFTIRREDPGGSALQQDHPTATAEGNSALALRADDFVYAVQPLGSIATGDAIGGSDADSWLEVTAVDYGVMRLAWEISIELDVPVLGQTLTELRIVFSDEGTPRSVNDGQTIVVLTKAHWRDEHIHTITEHPVTLAPFAYYSMFGRFTDGATVWYERVASLNELVVVDHGSHDQLWRRIPLHYRLLDDQVALSQDRVAGPLHDFLSVFGFEMDRHRSLIQQLWRINDPDFTHELSLNALAHQVGLMVDVTDIPSKFIRNVLSNYGFLRSRKGTLIGAMAYLNALTECPVTVLQLNETNLGVNSQIYRFMLGAQRVNLIISPRFQNGPGTGSPTWGIFLTLGDTSTVTWDPAARTITNTTGSLVEPVHVLPLDPVVLQRGVPYYGSVVLSTDLGAALDEVEYEPSFLLSLADAENDMTLGDPPYNPPGFVVSSTYDAQRRELRFSVTSEPTGAGADQITAYPVIRLRLPTDGVVLLNQWILQPFNPGPYFDGNSELGGFINDNDGNIAKDYRWTGSEGRSTSVYTEYLSHKRAAVLKSLDFLMPATFTLDATSNGFEFVFNVLPGEAEALASSTARDIVGRWPQAAPPPISMPEITAAPVVGQPIDATVAVWPDESHSLHRIENRWQLLTANGPTPLLQGTWPDLQPVTGTSFTPDASLEGEQVRYEERAFGPFGMSDWAVTAWSDPIAAAAP